MIEDLEDPVIEVLQVFGHRFRHRHYYSRVSIFQSETVASMWHAIADTHLLEGFREPRKPLGLHDALPILSHT